LAHALYQHDAACRVIARLIKERDAARNTLSSIQGQVPEHTKREAAADAMEVDGGAPALEFSETLKEKLQQKSQTLSQGRKKRQPSASLATQENIKEYKVLSSNTGFHKSTSPGIVSVDIHPTRQELVLTGGMDTSAILFNKDTSKIVSVLSGHTKPVNDALFHPEKDIIVTCSQDKTARIWRASDAAALNYTPAHVVKTHQDDVTGITLHSTGDYFVTASRDRTWAFHDLETGAPIVRATLDGKGCSSVQFHPDGLILATGTEDSLVRIWDIKLQQNVASFEGHEGQVVDLAFSENGFYLATAATDSVKLWDLRRLKNIHTIDVKGATSVNFDYSGNYLLVTAGIEIRVIAVAKSTFTPIRSFTDHTAVVSDAKFGKDATWIASASLDRSLKIFGHS